MIKNSFIFLPRIADRKEKNIWNQGIKDWDGFLKNDIKGISKKSKFYYDRQIKEASLSLKESNTEYFYDKLPSKETWRLYDYFKDEAVFMDIETSSTNGYLTVVGLFDGYETKTLVRPVNIAALRNELRKYKLIITFNGSVFDIPYIEKKYPGTILKIPNIDLRHLCAKVGLKGGLKDIEKEIGIERENKIIERLYSGDPIRLWRTFMATGDRYYLELLVEYNEEDVINLKKIAHYAVNKMKKQYNF